MQDNCFLLHLTLPPTPTPPPSLPPSHPPSFSYFSQGKGLKGQDYSFVTSTEHRKLCCDIRTWLHENIAHILKAYPPSSVLSPTSVRGHSKRDFSIYVGNGGNAYLHWKLSKFFAVEKNREKEEFHQQKAVEAVTVALSLLPTPSSEDIAFFLGGAGMSSPLPPSPFPLPPPPPSQFQ